MRTWGRVPNESSPTGYDWVEVATDANGFNDAVWYTTLCQVLALGLNESPIFGNWGIPAQQSIVTQVLPDYYVNLTQQQFASYFLSLIITKISANPPDYDVKVTANPGAILMDPVPY